VFRKLETLEKPVIAAVNGFALGGGCELSMACDIRIASVKAKFGQPEVGLGITPGFGGTQRLSRLVGLGMAKELIYTAKIIKADEALRIGLVNKVVEPENLLEEAKALANTIAGQAPIAVSFCKAAINKGIQLDIDSALSYESEIFGECFSTEDQSSGMTAFIEKTEKCFKNK
jgi:enoyl-CoA hydratase